MELNAKARRKEILNTLRGSDVPVSASSLAQQLAVSRQIIVGDVALLRASGEKIASTPRGYIFEDPSSAAFPFEGLIACCHAPEQLQEELYTIVDFGGYVINVMIEHPLYGQLSGALNLGSRYDVDLFLKQVREEDNAKPLSILTNGVHLHRIGCRDKETFDRIRNSLENKKIIFASPD